MKKIIIANWKMNFNLKQALEYIAKIKAGKNEVIIASPFVFLGQLKLAARKKKIKLAAQNVSQFDNGAYTGEISASMLKEAGCSYCLVGHSERRVYFNESDSLINQKIRKLLDQNIIPIVCIGENEAEHQKGEIKEVLRRQLFNCLHNISNFSKIIIAYEPVWAISTFQKGPIKKAADSNDIEAAHQFIKNQLLNMFGDKQSNFKILYGGTVNEDNARDILRLKNVDGALVGKASLKHSGFNAIIEAT
jgi:triosephosphate isomerase (TIM)